MLLVRYMWQEEREKKWCELIKKAKEEGRRLVEKGDGRWCAPEHERDAGVEGVEGWEEGGLRERGNNL